MTINLLPPQIKEQLAYSKRNIHLRRYVVLLALVAVSLASLIAGVYWYSGQQVDRLSQTLSDRQKQRSAYKDTEAKLQSLQSSVGLIEKLFTEKTQFSSVLGDLAAVLPSGTYIDSISLTGDDKKPLKLLVTADTLTQAGLVRNALLESTRISDIDIQSINKDEATNKYAVDLVIAFKEGQAR